MDRKPPTTPAGEAPRRSGAETAAQRPPLVIVGASCRAAAVSAAAVGWNVHAADLFADLDLAAATVSWRRVSGYPEGLVHAAADFPPAPWCYTGAVENHPQIIERLASLRPLAGNGGASVRRVRDPAVLSTVLRGAGLSYPDTHATPAGLPLDGSFLRKPLASAGGRGVIRWSADAAGHAADDDGVVWQRWVEGTPLAAVFALGGGTGRLLGVSRQLVGESPCRAATFAYCGSIQMPMTDLRAAVLEQLQRLGTVLADNFGLAGVVGVDMILDGDDRVTVIEVNPRPSASAELIERATDVSIMATHLAAFGLRAPATQPASRRTGPIWSKAILFTASAITVDARLLDHVRRLADDLSAADGWPAIADIPRSEQVLRAGAPVLTLFAHGETTSESHAELCRRGAALTAIIG